MPPGVPHVAPELHLPVLVCPVSIPCPQPYSQAPQRAMCSPAMVYTEWRIASPCPSQGIGIKGWSLTLEIGALQHPNLLPAEGSEPYAPFGVWQPLPRPLPVDTNMLLAGIFLASFRSCGIFFSLTEDIGRVL